MSTMLNAAGQLLFQWQSTRNQSFFCTVPSNLDHGSICWVKPQMVWLKCNVDAATFASKGIVTYGGIVRCFGGSFVAAKCGYVLGKFGAREAKALAVRKILS